MIIELSELVKKYNLKIKGVLHIGAHMGQEAVKYYELGIKNAIFFEPQAHIYSELVSNLSQYDYYKNDSWKSMNTALGNENGQRWMWIENKNQGQSSSILEPIKHLEIYPDIVFENKMYVNIKRLDSISIKTEDFNFINIDVQGAELLVFEGAINTLKNIDYIYTEVNRDELYADCAKIEQLDIFLNNLGFERVEVNWAGGTWGDALYIKNKKILQPKENVETKNQSVIPKSKPVKNEKEGISKNIDIDLNNILIDGKYVKVPEIFRPEPTVIYPRHNTKIFEQYFFERYIRDLTIAKRKFKYLPVIWTAYYINNKFGTSLSQIDKLQEFINQLPKGKYFTLIQYDDGILNDLSKLGKVIIFASGGRGALSENCTNIPIPLLSQAFTDKFEDKKDIFASFIGQRATHQIRHLMFESLSNKEDYYISNQIRDIKQYSEILHRSKFVLCPRGYGITSFRIQEALQHSAIPVYISDKFWLPGDIRFDDYGVLIKSDQITNIDNILKTHYNNEATINRMVQAGKKAYQKYYTYFACYNFIIEFLSKL